MGNFAAFQLWTVPGVGVFYIICGNSRECA